MNGDLLDDKILNLVGVETYEMHSNLIKEIVKDKSKFITNGSLHYDLILETLTNEGLINLKLEEQAEVTVLFTIQDSHKRSYKILKDVLSSMGYAYYFTDFIKNTGGKLVWQIRFKSDFALDSLEFARELKKFSTKITDINKIFPNSWEYEIDGRNGMLLDVLTPFPNESVTLGIPLQPYVVSIANGSEMTILSNKANNWIPKISFYDIELNSLGTIEMDRVYEGIKVAIPKNSQYVKISDRYSLLNIKRGLVVTISTALKK
jgi:hypothetical protein